MSIKQIRIDTPPPTISGDLHIGHIFSYCHIDIIARYNRLIKNNVHFPIGFDCNGLNTEELMRKDKQYSLDKYIDRYIDLFKKMGFTMDFENYYKTLDFDIYCNNIFSDFKRNNIIYQSTKECNFDPIYKTALTNTEIDEIDGKLISQISKKEVIKQEATHWYVKTIDIKEELLKFVEPINFYPKSRKKDLINWIKNLNQDWCISRDRQYGVKILNTNQVYNTWFASALTHRYTDCFAEPSDLRFQGHDIIVNWCFYSIVLSYYIDKKLPFKDVIISGWVVDKNGNKFSKSLGNFKDVNKLIEQYGVNPLRYWCAYSGIGSDTYLDENVIKTGRRLYTKIINAERFFDMNLSDKSNKDEILLKTDFEVEFKKLMNDYNISEAIKYLYKSFFEFCDFNIEACKKQSELLNENYTRFLIYKNLFSVFFNF